MKRLLFILSIVLSPLAAMGQITAPSCSVADVTSAWSGVTSSTTTFTIPAGSCNWTTSVTLNVPSGSKSLSIIGQGSVTGTDSLGNPTSYDDQTVIIDNDSSTNQVLTINTASSCTLLRMTGMTFKGGSGGVKDPVIGVSGSCGYLRVDHNHLLMSAYTNGGGNQQFRFSGQPYGVMDHNLCDDATSGAPNECWDVWDDGYGGGSYGDGAWNAPSNLGGSNFMFFEDNTVNGGTYAQDCLGGGRGVVRYNTINAVNMQTHPLAGGTRNRGCRAQEVYKNQINGNSSCNGSSGFANCTFNVYWLSGGTGVIWGNNIPVVNAGAGSGYQWIITAHSMRANNNTYAQNPVPNGWGYCGTQSGLTGDMSPWDGAPSTPTGYPCLDDPGRGVEALGPINSQYFPNALNQQTGTAIWTQQALEPVYEWLDGVSGVFTPVPMNPGGPLSINDGVLQQNRDIYLYNASFTGATGVGTGLFSARPSTCTAGVAYWATDQNELYKCTGNAWSAYYTPYTYPHPLDGGGGGGSSGVGIPTGLTATAGTHIQ